VSPADWLTGFLTRHDCARPDGRPLYAYRCADDELDALGETLRAVRVTRSAAGLDGLTGAAFCLYAAEWWRRRHAGGAWAWSGILASVGWDGVSLPSLYGPVETGLAEWGRPVLRSFGKRMFLVTLACEGGLPLQLLRSEAGPLRRFFQAVLRDVQRFRRFAPSATALAEAQASLLPRSLRHDVVFELAGRLTEAVWRLQGELVDDADPVRQLDRVHPDWRHDIPLTLDDTVAETLFRNLVHEATRLATRQAARFVVVRSLREAQGSWRLESELRLPPAVDAEELAGSAGVGTDVLPSRCHLHLAVGGGPAVPVAQATRMLRRDDGARFLLEAPRRDRLRQRGAAAAGAAEIALVAGSTPLGRFAVPGGGPLGDLPWVFAGVDDDEHLLELAGEGAVHTRDPVAYVALPAGWTLHGAVPGALDDRGLIEDFERKLVRLAGSGTAVSDDGERCEIRTGSDRDLAVNYRLEGETLPYGGSGVPLFRGLPRLVEERLGAPRRVVPSDAVEWRSRPRRGAWTRGAARCRGAVSVRYVADGELRFQARIDVVPAAARVALEPDRRGRRGRVRFTGLAAAHLGLEPATGVTETIAGGGDADWVLTLSAAAAVPAAVQCHVRWTDAEALTLEIPFPVREARFVGAGDRLLPNEAAVSLDRLHTVRARVIDVLPDAGFAVEGTLVAKDIPAAHANRYQFRRRLTAVAPQQYELSLYAVDAEVRYLLGVARDLDAYVKLRVESEGAPIGPRFLVVQRFDRGLVLDFAAGEVGLGAGPTGGRDTETWDLLEMQAFPMWAPERQPETLPVCGPLRWRFAPHEREDGPWLLVGCEGDRVRTRPSLWNVRPTGPEHEPAGGLAGVVRIGDEDARRAALDAVLARLATSATDPDWEVVLAYFTRYRNVSKSTLMLFDRLIDHPDAAALAVMQTGGADELDTVWCGLEELPFLWALVPVESWMRAAARIAVQFAGTGVSPSTIGGQFATLCTRGPQRLRGFGVVAELLAERYAIGDVASAARLAAARTLGGRARLQRELGAAQQQLVTVHVGDRWPVGTTTTGLAAALGPLPAGLDSLWRQPARPYQDPVTNAPIAAALAAALGVRLDAARVREIRWCRLFDEAWFETAYEIALAVAVATTMPQER